MQNKYPGKCFCGVKVGANEGVAMREGAGRWEVRCAEHAAVKTSAAVMVSPEFPLSRPTPIFDAAPQVKSTVLDSSVLRSEYYLLSGHKASEQQAIIFDHFKNSRSSAIIEAVAGSGKTTSVKNAIRYLPEYASVQMFAFNTDAARQLKDAIAELEAVGDRTYSNVRAGTFHSVGFGAVLRYLDLPKEQVEVTTSKLRNLFKEQLGVNMDQPASPEKRLFDMYSAFVTKLVAFAKGQGVGCLIEDNQSAYWNIIDHHDMSLESEEADIGTAIAYARELLQRSNKAAKAGYLDYDDMLYCVVLWKLRLFENDVVICDEAQDVSNVRLAILRLSLRNGGKLYAVGDRKQGIYAFAGANADAMDQIKEAFNCQELKLSVSYRCARKIVERAQTWVPYIEASDFAEEGIVDDDVPLHLALSSLTAKDAILCRQTAPLVDVAYQLIAAGRACRIAGKEIGEGLVNLIEQQKAKGVDRLREKLEKWRDREMAKFIAKGDDTKAEAVADRVDCVFVLIGALPETERTIPALIAKIRSMFEQDDGAKQTCLMLSSQHKAKGKEWECVVWLLPDLNPSKAARKEHQREQEFHLMYVTTTRAKRHLIVCKPGDREITAPKKVAA